MKLKQKTGWADRRLAAKKVKRASVKGHEYLTGCVIRRGGVLHGDLRVFRSHSEIRRSLGDEDPYTERPGDEHLFVTNRGRLIGRIEGSTVAVLAEQAAPMYEGRAILSSDITWRTV